MNKKSIIVLALVIIVIAGVIGTQSAVNANSAQTLSPETSAGTEAEADMDDAASVEEVVLADKIDHEVLNNAPLPTDFVMGDVNAPVTLVEYASLSCPHCAEFHEKVLPKLKKNYIETGKLKYILRQFPLNEPAMMGAMLVQCAGEEGGADRYYQFNNVLFGAQNKWAFDANFKDYLRTFAEVGGMSGEEFETCLADKKREKFLLETRQVAGEHLAIDGTPYIILNGHPHKGNRAFNAIKPEIEYLLAQ